MERNSTPKDQIQAIVEKYINNTCSKEELNQFLNLAKEGSDELFDALKVQWLNQKEKAFISNDRRDELFNSMMDKAKAMEFIDKEESVEEQEKVHRIGSNRRSFILRIAAAAVLIVLATTAVFLFRKDPTEIADDASKKGVVNDVAPGGDKAVLTLANGTKIILDTASNGALAQEGSVKVIKIGGQLTYDSEGISTQVLYNTITTPRGGQYRLELADGTKVWLNASSSLTFPTAFIGEARTVEITGEGYFEVAHDPAVPFNVKVNEMEVTVLGTHFNINSYTDESDIKTTLLEGRVQVKNSENHVYVNPGQQVRANGSQLQIENNVDLDEVVAWKNGLFSFNDADIKTVMRQLSRWYDIDVIYQGTNDETFSGKIDRNISLRDLLEGLGQTKVHYRIEEGGKLVILP